MKLSEKGKSQIREQIDAAYEAWPDDAKGVQVLAKKYLTECDNFELESDSFEDAVVLKIEEAKAVLSALHAIYALKILTSSVTTEDLVMAPIMEKLRQQLVAREKENAS